MTDHIEKLSVSVRPKPANLAGDAIKHHVIADAPPNYDDAMAAIRPAASWVRLLVLLVLTGLSWTAVILFSLMMLK